jgi:hypothetical protein
LLREQRVILKEPSGMGSIVIRLFGADKSICVANGPGFLSKLVNLC